MDERGRKISKGLKNTFADGRKGQAEGYDCIVIWEHELKDPNTVITRISDFAGAA